MEASFPHEESSSHDEIREVAFVVWHAQKRGVDDLLK